MQAGDLVPDFELDDSDGHRVRLSALLADGPVVLFFYPRASSSGCTRESCHFRDLAAEFAAAGAQRVGISTDPVAAQRKFATEHSFDYPLLSDPDGAVAKAFGVKRRFGPLPVKRKTFVIETDRRLIAEISSEVNMNTHADEALDALKTRSA